MDKRREFVIFHPNLCHLTPKYFQIPLIKKLNFTLFSFKDTSVPRESAVEVLQITMKGFLEEVGVTITTGTHLKRVLMDVKVPFKMYKNLQYKEYSL